MKWFQHDSDSRNDPKIKAIITQFGNQGFGCLVRIWEHVADHGHDPGVGIKADGRPLPLLQIAGDAGESIDYVRTLLDFCAEVEHIDPAEWSENGVVAFPAMAQRADTYTKRLKSLRTNVEHRSKSVRQQDKTTQHKTAQHKTEQGVGFDLSSPNGSQPQQLFQLWNSTVVKPIPQVRRLDASRERLALAALKAVPDLATWRELFEWLNVQPWGRKNGKGTHANWTFTFSWVLKAGKFQELIEQMRTGGPSRDPESSGRAKGDRDDYRDI